MFVDTVVEDKALHKPAIPYRSLSSGIGVFLCL